VTGGWRDYWKQDVKKYCFAHDLKTDELRSLCTTYGKAEMEDMKERGNLEDLGYVGGQ
jgi:hypothetical protein